MAAWNERLVQLGLKRGSGLRGRGKDGGPARPKNREEIKNKKERFFFSIFNQNNLNSNQI